MNTKNTNGLSKPNIAVFTAGGFNNLDAMYDGLVGSTFTTVVLWSSSVDTSGNFQIRNIGLPGSSMASNGVFNPTNDPQIAAWQQKVLGLKTADTSIARVELSIGVGSYTNKTGQPVIDPSFPNIKAIYESEQLFATTLILNLQAIQRALNIDAVCFDDEVAFDHPSSLWLAQACGLLGMTVSISPCGSSQKYWGELVTAANSKARLIDAVYLQAWTSGCSGWILGGLNPVAGMYIDNPDLAKHIAPIDATNQLQTWQKGSTILAGGWYYNAGEILGNPALGTFSEYSNAIRTAF